MAPVEHLPGCALDAVHWLRHAVAAAGRLAQPHPDDYNVDRKSAEALTDALAHFSELDNWATVTLRDVAMHSTLMDEGRFGYLCTCGAANPGSQPGF